KSGPGVSQANILRTGIFIRRRAYFALGPEQVQSSDVQCGQRVARIEMAWQQRGHSRVSGVAGASGAAFSRCRRLMARISRKTAKATIRKLMTAFRNRP